MKSSVLTTVYISKQYIHTKLQNGSSKTETTLHVNDTFAHGHTENLILTYFSAD